MLSMNGMALENLTHLNRGKKYIEMYGERELQTSNISICFHGFLLSSLKRERERERSIGSQSSKNCWAD